jgi:hypothetical protein
LLAIRATIGRRRSGYRLGFSLAVVLFATAAFGGEGTERQRPAIESIRADAGADQNADVGDRVTLDGSRSRPSAGGSYRWIAAGGPPIRLLLEDRHTLTWIPESPGVYRFALVVAAEGGISAPDYVEITVAESPKKTASDPDVAVVMTGALRSLNATVSTAGALAEIADRIASKAELYESYNMLLQELSRSLDAVIPPDAATRSSWNERLFVPLSRLLMERLRAESLDLSRPEALGYGFNVPQRVALAAFFHEMASAGRAYRDGDHRSP